MVKTCQRPSVCSGLNPSVLLPAEEVLFLTCERSGAFFSNCTSRVSGKFLYFCLNRTLCLERKILFSSNTHNKRTEKSSVFLFSFVCVLLLPSFKRNADEFRCRFGSDRSALRSRSLSIKYTNIIQSVIKSTLWHYSSVWSGRINTAVLISPTSPSPVSFTDQTLWCSSVMFLTTRWTHKDEVQNLIILHHVCKSHILKLKIYFFLPFKL